MATPTVLAQNLYGGAGFTAATVMGRTYFANGRDAIRSYCDHRKTVIASGIAGPAVAPVMSDVGGGTVVAGNYICTYVYLDEMGGPPEIGAVSKVAPLAVHPSVGGNKKIRFAVVQSSNARVTKIALLITGVGDTVLGQVAVVANTTGNYDVDKADIDNRTKLLYIVQPNTNATDWDLTENGLPPVGSIVLGHRSILAITAPLPYSTGSVTTVSGSPVVTLATGVVSSLWAGQGPMKAWYFRRVGDSTAYLIVSVNVGANTFSLTQNYPTTYATPQSYAVYSAELSKVWTSAPGFPEAYKNECGFDALGEEEAVKSIQAHPNGYLIYSETKMEVTMFQTDPSDNANLQFVPVPGRRGAVNHNVVQSFEGKYFALDRMGVHVWNSGGASQDISRPIRDRLARINWAQASQFFASIIPAKRLYRLHVCLDSETVPKEVLTYDIDDGHWKTGRNPTGATSSTLIKDADGTLRPLLGFSTGYTRFEDIGTTDGVRTGTTCKGTVAGTPSATVVEISEGGLDTTGQALKGSYVYSEELDEYVEIASNTVTVLTLVSPGFSVAPTVGTLVHIGGVPVELVTRTYTAPHPNFVQQGFWFTLMFKPLAVERYAYVSLEEGLDNAVISGWATATGDGWTTTLNNKWVKVNLSNATGIVKIPSGYTWRLGIRFRIKIWDADVDTEIYRTHFEARGERKGVEP